jgi:4-alpha-glucanotransferase
VDVVRLDHFRAFSAAWHIPAESPTAQSGSWEPGPGADFFHAIERELGGLPFIAEDLGYITPDVYALRDQFHLPGMRVLQFAFDGNAGNPHLPGNYTSNTVVYTGTHDNSPSRCWYENLPADQQANVTGYLKSRAREVPEVARQLIHIAWSSPAALAIAPFQDVLNLGCEARMNVPGRPDGNWRWRTTEEMLSGSALDFLSELTVSTNRGCQTFEELNEVPQSQTSPCYSSITEYTGA